LGLNEICYWHWWRIKGFTSDEVAGIGCIDVEGWGSPTTCNQKNKNKKEQVLKKYYLIYYKI